MRMTMPNAGPKRINDEEEKEEDKNENQQTAKTLSEGSHRAIRFVAELYWIGYGY